MRDFSLGKKEKLMSASSLLGVSGLSFRSLLWFQYLRILSACCVQNAGHRCLQFLTTAVSAEPHCALSLC